MSDTTNAAVQAAVRLRVVLDDLGDAMRDVDLRKLLAAESALVAALARFGVPLGAPADRASLFREVERLRRALDRCRRLGATIEEMLRMAGGVMSPASAYTRAGRERDLAPARVLEARG